MAKKYTSLNGFRLVQTCWACPEQYDVFKNDKQVGYLRLRHGSFTVEVPDCGGKLVLEADTRGDGAFDSDEERKMFLVAAIKAIQKELCGE